MTTHPTCLGPLPPPQSPGSFQLPGSFSCMGLPAPHPNWQCLCGPKGRIETGPQRSLSATVRSLIRSPDAKHGLHFRHRVSGQ